MKFEVEVPDNRPDLYDAFNTLLKALGHEVIEKPKPRFVWNDERLQDLEAERQGDFHVCVYHSYPFDEHALKQVILDHVNAEWEDSK